MFKHFKRFFYTHVLNRKYYRSGSCLGCGRCCEKIYVKHGKTVIQDEERFNKLKYLHSFYMGLEVIGKDETGLIFKCTNLDEKTRLCKMHDKRPEICRKYPQEEIFMMGGMLGEDCGYKFTPIVPFSEILQNITNKKK